MSAESKMPDSLPAKSTDDCPVCAGESKRRFEKDGYWIRGCLNCRFEYLEELPAHDHVGKVYGDDYFFGGGAGYPNYAAGGDLVRAHGQRYAKVLSRYMRPGVVLDIGAAAGFFLAGLSDGGWQGEGLEPNGSMARFGRDALGMHIFKGTLEDLPTDVKTRQYDLVSMVQVVPHFFDIHAAFRAASTITKPGGFWLVETWNVRSLSARVFGQQWHEYSPPSVLRWFTPKNLTTLCEVYGFSRVANGRPRKWISGAHVKSLLNHKLTLFPLNLAKPLLRLVPDRFPIPYPSEDLFWLLLRKTSNHGVLESEA